jgi:hypothetical protein
MSKKDGGPPKRATNNKPRYLAYKTQQRREFNKVRRLHHYLRRHSHDFVALLAYNTWYKKLFDAQRKRILQLAS